MKLRPDDSGRPLWSREEAERIWRGLQEPEDDPEPEDAA